MNTNNVITTTELINIAIINEAKTLYYSHKASCHCPDVLNCNCEDEWDTLTLTGGGSAHCVLSGNTITVNFFDGTISTYTHDDSEIVPDGNLMLKIVESEPNQNMIPITKLI